MQALVQQWEASGEFGKECVKRHGLALARFDYWKRRVRRDEGAAARIKFAPVRVVTEAKASERGAVPVVLASGDQMTIGERGSVGLLRTVMSVLTRRRRTPGHLIVSTYVDHLPFALRV